jgi:outer membrane protein OmpA-like peptidoglycan-associated protein
MSASILDTLRRMVTPSVVSQLSGLYDVPSQSVEKGLTAAIPAVLAPLAARADDRDFMSQIFALAKDPTNDPAILDNPERLFEKARTPTAGTGIIGQLQTLLFGNGLSGITEGLARYAGLKGSTASSLISLAAPMVLACLNRVVRDDKLDATGLARRLSSEKLAIGNALPMGLAHLMPSIPATANDRAPRTFDRRDVEETVRAAIPPAPQRSSMGWLIPALLALLAIGALYAMLRRDRVPETTQATVSGPAPVGTSGYVTRTLPGGTDVRVPPTGTEARLLNFIESPAPADRETWFEFDRLNFETDSARLREDSQEQLRNIASILKAYPQVRAKIGGYTDNSGDPGANRRLSEARAMAVMNTLKDNGIAADRLEAEGYGDQHPIADNSTPDGRARNRRVAIRVTSR